MVLLRPFVRQEYVYYGKDKPEAFWVHFTGYRAEALLDAAGFAQNQILYAGVFFRIQGPVFPDDTGTSGVPSGL